MGILRLRATGATQPLTTRTSVGRAATSTLYVVDMSVSQQHALLTWSRGAWYVHDLHSRNGTYIDGTRLPRGAIQRVDAGASVSFGSLAQTWDLVDASEPGLFAMHSMTRQTISAVDGILALPDGPVVAYDAKGGVLIDDDDVSLRHLVGPIVSVAPSPWLLIVPDSPTDQTFDVADEAPSFRFTIPRTEEGVVLTVVMGHESIVVPPREHIYILLVLARARWDDRRKNEDERGWLHRDQLRAALRMEDTAIRVAIHRARAQLAQAGVQGADTIVETRRPHLRRFGSDRLEFLNIG